MKNITGSAPLGVAFVESRILISFHHPDNEYEREILTRKITYALLAINTIIFALGIIGNGLVIFVLGFHMKKTANTIWFLNFTVANFVFTCSLPLRIAHHAFRLHWPFGKPLCKLNNSIAYLNLYASAYFLTVLSVGHCASVRSSAWAQRLQRNRVAWFVACGVWFLALAFSSPRIHFRSTEPSPIDKEVVICFFSYGTSSEQAKINHHVIQICQYIFGFFIPVGVTIVCYWKIGRQQRPVMPWARSFKVLTTVTVVFYLCWVPYHVFSFFETRFIQTSGVLIVGIPLTTGLAFASSCINPIIYIVTGYDFKERPRPPILSAFENVFGEETNGSGPKTQASPPTEENSQDL